MSVHQTTVRISGKTRGCHLITREVEQAISEFGLEGDAIAHVFLQHTSASISLNENASPDVRRDMESILNHLVPENEPYYRHTLEGADDMPAHAKSSLLGTSLTVPVTRGRLNLGTWQGIYLCEHRNHGGTRSLVVTVLA